MSSLLSRIPSVIASLVVLALLALAALGVRSWLAARETATQLAATVATQKQLLDQAAAREQQRDAALAVTLNDIHNAKNKVQTPAEAATQIPTVLPQLPAPVTITVPAEPVTKAGNTGPSNAPIQPAAASIPQADLKPLYDYLEDCRACQAQLTAAQSDLADERSKVTALTTERDAAMKAAKGGGFWSRLRHSPKWFAIGAAIGALSVAARPR